MLERELNTLAMLITAMKQDVRDAFPALTAPRVDACPFLAKQLSRYVPTVHTREITVKRDNGEWVGPCMCEFPLHSTLKERAEFIAHTAPLTLD